MSTVCPLAGPETISLAEAFHCFEKEAVRGFCDTGRYRCAFFTWGEGPPLVFLPGLADDMRSFVLLSAHLAGRFRCIGYDMPAGRGDGARLSSYTHAHLVDDALALLDHLHVSQSHLLGSSFGGTVALAVMRAYPERVNRAVIQGSFARRPLAPAEVLLAGLARYWPGPMSRLPLRRAILHRTHHEPFSNRPEEVWEFFLSRWGAQPMAAVARRALLLHRLDLRPTLAEIRHPVLLVCGDADPLVSPSCEEELLRGLPNVVRVQLENCGHLPLFTHPGTLADLLRGFLLPPGSQPTKLTCRPDGV